MKTVCAKCEVVYLIHGEAPVDTLRCPRCHGYLKSYEEEKKRIEVWISYGFIIIDLARLAMYPEDTV